MELKNSQISFIVNDLHKKGLVYEPLEEEIIDHFCCMIEDYMESGMSFGDAYKKALNSFGSSKELKETQQQTIIEMSVRFRNRRSIHDSQRSPVRSQAPHTEYSCPK